MKSLPESQRPRRRSDGTLISDPYGAVRIAGTKRCRKDPMPLGTVVIRCEIANGRRRYTRFIKVKMTGPYQKKWIQYSRWWWEKNRGPIPEGQLVLRKDGQTLNDSPDNLILGTPGMKLVLAHQRDQAWSREQHARAGAGTAKDNRRRGQTNRFWKFLTNYWYPVVDSVSVILNVPFRRRSRLIRCFGGDVSRYPKNGHGAEVEKAIKSSKICPVKGSELSIIQYGHYCVVDPETRECRGPMSSTLKQIVAQLERMGIWETAEKQAKKHFRDRK